MSFSPYRPRPPVERIDRHDPAVWVEAACIDRRFGYVEAIVPPVYAAYARVFHPFRDESAGRSVRWSEIATRTGRTVHRLMQMQAIVTPAGDPIPTDWNVFQKGPHPDEGTLPVEVADPLVEILRATTTTPQACFFGVWNGFGAEPAQRPHPPASLHLPERSFVVFEGPVEGLFCFPDSQSPNCWWPKDRAWFVATEIDAVSTYVGGSEACIASILSDAHLESFPARPDDPISGTVEPAS